MIKIILSDRDIKQKLKESSLEIKPLDEGNIGPSGVDLKLGYQIRVYKDMHLNVLNPFEDYNIDEITELIEPTNGKFRIKPGDLILVTCLEWLSIPRNLVARIISRSSLSRLGIVILGTSGTVEPGFKGFLTIAIENVGRTPVILYPEMSFCQLVLETLSSSAEVSYEERRSSKYHEQKGPIPSRMFLEKKE